ncbi:MAG: glycosyltransferase family 9 protein [Silvibacterium sp.]
MLIYRLGSLGDTVAALPALHLVARTFPDARRLMLTNLPVHAKAPAPSAVLGDSGLVHGHINYPVGTRSVRQLARVWREIRRFRPQVLIYLANARGGGAIKRDALFFKACGIPRIIGLPLGDLAEPLYLPELDIWERESARLVRTIRELGECDIDDLRNWDLRLTEPEKRAADAALAPATGKRLLVCGPGTKMQAKDWGDENWRQLLTRLSAALPDHALALVGAKEDAQVSDYAAAGWQGPIMNLCGQLTPRETAAALRNAVLFLGPDSGPMHLAAAAGVPCAIAFAARTMPGIWYPGGQGNRVVYHRVDCMGCNIETCIEQKKKCLTSITVDEMLAAALEALSYGRKGQASQPV